MGLDKRLYSTLQGVTRSEFVQFIDASVLQSFLVDLIAGTVANYSLADFLNNKSDWVSKIMYLPIDYTKFAPTTPPLLSSWLILGNQQYTDYAVKTFNTVGQYFQIELFSYTFFTRPTSTFLDFKPYSQIDLYVPYFDLISLDPNIVWGKTIKGYLSLDFHTGKLTLYIYLVYDSDNNKSILLETKYATIGIDVSIGKSNIEEIRRNNLLQSISLMGSVATIGVGMATENPLAIGGGIALATKGITTALQNNVNHLKGYKGGSGDRTELSVDKNIYIIYTLPNDVRKPSLSIKGGICQKNKSLSATTGYTEIGYMNFNPSNVAIYDDEIEEIQQLLRAGVIL